ncbi:Ig-like domain-containing protein [Treponema sp. HNW]|uniref:Ig-like domain-containing protein n=1 Tax=Treponema sp. HNW TaxID=3116654 RepID=UPI003D14BBA9
MKKYSYIIIGILLSIIAGCSLFLDPKEVQEKSQNGSVPITALRFGRSSVSLGIGGMEYIPLTVSPSNAGGSVSYSTNIPDIISVEGDRSGVSVTGKRNGNVILKAIADNGISTACVISVTGVDPTVENSPQINSTTIALELEQGVSKRVQVALKGGSAADMAAFQWSIDKSNIASLEGSGQSAYITAKENGIAQVTVTHPLATYPYTFLVFVKPDAEKAVYITNNQNIMVLDRNAGDKMALVNLINGEESDNPFFRWSVLNNAESDASCISILANGKNCVITPVKSGTAFVQVSHPKAQYPYLIRCKVVTIVKNVIIEPSVTKLTLEGTAPQSVTAQLTGAEGDFDIGEFIWSTEDDTLLELSPFQNSCGVQGKSNGTGKITVTHPLAKYPREILVFVQNHPAGSIDGGMYITTSQDYIRTKVGAADTTLNISLAGGEPGDEAQFKWTVNNRSIIELNTTHGIVAYARSVFSSYTDGKAYIKPKKEGTAVISISHPKIVVPREVLVTVLPETALLDAPLHILGQDVIGIVVGESRKTVVTLTGNTVIGDEQQLDWQNENSNVVNLSAVNGVSANLTATGVGESFVSISHPKAQHPKKILVYTAATQEELEAKKVLYTSKNQYNVVANGEAEYLYVYTIGLDATEIGNIQWHNSNPTSLSIETGTTNAECVIKGLSAGTATVTARHPQCIKPVEFQITVFPAGTDLGVIPSPTYLTTGRNVVQFTNANETQIINVTPVKLPPEKYSAITWTGFDTTVCSVVQNGNKATVTSVGEGETKIKVAHPESENELFITVRVGNQYISPSIKTPYVEVSQDVIGLVNGGSGQKINAHLENSSSVNKNFTWQLDNPAIAEITPLQNSCFVVPKSPGQAQLTVSHPEAPNMDKKVLVLVGNSADELATMPFLTTSQNVVVLRKGSQQNVQVRVANAPQDNAGTYAWAVKDNPGVVQVISSGHQAIFKALNEGIAHIEVRHTGCTYPLEITVEVQEDVPDAADHPFITNNQNIVPLTAGGAAKSINVNLMGGTLADNSDFTWSFDRADIISMVANGQNAVVRGLAPGDALITVQHPKAQYPYPIKVVVDKVITGPALYIKTSPANILSLKPADSEQTVTATLVGGKPEDMYGFKWYADNYNVIDLTATANTAVIKPRAEGTAKITITHPKALDGELTVRVTEYSKFEFSMTNLTMTEGDTQFVSMKVPAMENDYSGKIVYTTDNPRIVTIGGTNKVAQLTAVAPGTATVTATSPSGAKSDMLVYVKQAAAQTLPHITSSTNVLSFKVTDNQRSVTAQLVGQDVLPTDQYNLQWAVDNPAIVKLVGTTGSTVLLKPLKPGETTLKITHEKTDTVFSIYIEVTGSDQGISLNKSYMALETGKTIEITATIDNGTAADYGNITWSADKVNNLDIVSILGSGKTVAIYGLASGRTKVSAEWNGGKASCDVVVTASRQFSFDTQTLRVQPGQTKTVKYTLVPDDANIQWFVNTNEYITYQVDTAAKVVRITGIKENPMGGLAVTNLSGISNSMRANLSITTAWDYKLTLGKSQIKSEPRYDPNNPDKFIIPYEVHPENARIETFMTSDGVADVYVDTAKRQIVLTPTGEGDTTLRVTAFNTNVSPEQPFPNMIRECKLYFHYQNLNIRPSIISKTGSFSRYDETTGILIIGDGEEVELGFGAQELNADWSFSPPVIVHKDSTSPITVKAGVGENTYKLVHPKDTVEQVYLVDRDCWFECQGNRSVITWKRRRSSPTWTTHGKEWSTHYFYPFVAMNHGRDSTIHLAISGALPGVTLKTQMFESPQRVKITDFERNTDWYAPAIRLWAHGPTGPTSTENYASYDSYPAVQINRWAKKVNSIDKTVVSSVHTDNLVLSYRHNGRDKKITIPVYTEIRNCPYNQQ